MKETFEEYLMGKCMEETHALDDDLPDTYASWIGEQDVEDIIRYATQWHNKTVENRTVTKEYKIIGDEIVADIEALVEKSKSCTEQDIRDDAVLIALRVIKTLTSQTETTVTKEEYLDGFFQLLVDKGFIEKGEVYVHAKSWLEQYKSGKEDDK